MSKDDPATRERLARALRQNLRRRKEQARDQAAPAPVTPPEEPSRR